MILFWVIFPTSPRYKYWIIGTLLYFGVVYGLILTSSGITGLVSASMLLAYLVHLLRVANFKAMWSEMTFPQFIWSFVRNGLFLLAVGIISPIIGFIGLLAVTEMLSELLN